MPSEPPTILVSSKKAQRGAAGMHMIAGAGLLSARLVNLSSTEHAVLAYTEIAVGALLVLGELLVSSPQEGALRTVQ